MTSQRLALVLVAALVGCREGGSRPEITVEATYAYAPPTRSEAAAYATLRNGGGVPDTLVSISSPIAESVILHRQVGAEGTGGLVHMEPVGSLEIPERGWVIFEPGELHLMLSNLAALPQPGDSLSLTFTFRTSGPITVWAPVIPYGASPPQPPDPR